jgi:tetratricopeptide (TPR) repeat protein
MERALIDLTAHGIEHLAERVFALNGVDYKLVEKIAEGGNKIVYALRNERTQFIQFVAKIYKETAHSSLIDRLHETRRLAFEFRILCDLDGRQSGLALPGELYAVPGGVLEFEPIFSSNDPAAQDLEVAREHFANGRFDAGIDEYNRALQENSLNAQALVELGACLLNIGKPTEAIRVLEQSRKLEPNRVEVYLNLSAAFLAVGDPVIAIEKIDLTLNRYRLDPRAWARKVQIATNHNMDALLESMIGEVKDFPALTARFNKGLESVQQRLMLKNAAMKSASIGEWKKAADSWDQFFASSQLSSTEDALRSCWAHFNASSFLNAAKLAFEALPRARGGLDHTLALLAIVSCSRSGQVEAGRAVAAQMDMAIDDPMELPGWPTHIDEFVSEGSEEKHFGSIESLDDKEIMSALEKLQMDHSSGASSHDHIVSLQNKYRAKTVQLGS